ncbi:GNAT family N-acetyltransferase [Microbulbifer sediminum]|uniref:GNAT family N-acetyltransferase n=1 Tax=Microbulbifer sediminum TaxID=2904250 RepID=UPI001F415015|nr:GNAT family N-acetyltransferase [Microbulbifer sediminum]
MQVDDNSRLVPAGPAHRATLMSWLPDAHSCRQWGGPWFRYPFDGETFDEDCGWHERPGLALEEAAAAGSGNDLAAPMLAFGRFYRRLDRCHLGHLIVAPQQRGRGLGATLVRGLCAYGSRQLGVEECSLFVMKDNAVARSLYHRLGFRSEPYPEDADWLDLCDYMVAPLNSLKLSLPIT